MHKSPVRNGGLITTLSLDAPSLEPANLRITTIRRLGPSPAERVDRVNCLNNNHQCHGKVEV